MNYRDSQLRNNKRNNLDSSFFILKPLLEVLKFIYIWKMIQLKKV